MTDTSERPTIIIYSPFKKYLKLFTIKVIYTRVSTRAITVLPAKAFGLTVSLLRVNVPNAAVKSKKLRKRLISLKCRLLPNVWKSF